MKVVKVVNLGQPTTLDTPGQKLRRSGLSESRRGSKPVGTLRKNWPDGLMACLPVCRFAADRVEALAWLTRRRLGDASEPRHFTAPQVTSTYERAYPHG